MESVSFLYPFNNFIPAVADGHCPFFKLIKNDVPKALFHSLITQYFITDFYLSLHYLTFVLSCIFSLTGTEKNCFQYLRSSVSSCIYLSLPSTVKIHTITKKSKNYIVNILGISLFFFFFLSW